MKEPAWLTSLIDQRVALVEDKIGDIVLDTNIIMTPLTEPPEGASERALKRWDRSCDNPGCHRYCSDPQPFFTLHVVRTLRHGTKVYMTAGLCADCKRQLD